MKEARRLDLRLVLLVAFVAAAIWAATALAGGSEPASDPGAGNAPASGLVQNEGDGGAQPPSSDDCPDRGGPRGDDGSGGGAPDV